MGAAAGWSWVPTAKGCRARMSLSFRGGERHILCLEARRVALPTRPAPGETSCPHPIRSLLEAPHPQGSSHANTHICSCCHWPPSGLVLRSRPNTSMLDFFLPPPATHSWALSFSRSHPELHPPAVKMFCFLGGKKSRFAPTCLRMGCQPPVSLAQSAPYPS